MSPKTRIVAVSLGITLATACSDDDSETSGTQTPACVENPDLTKEGEAIPLGVFEFRNAFDPQDPRVYDPSDAASLPGPLMVDAWGDRSSAAHGTLGVFPPGFAAPLHTHSETYYGVVLRGQMTNPFGTDLEVFLDGDPNNNHGQVRLGPGAFWVVPRGSQHTTTCVGPEPCWFYFHAEAAFDFSPIVDATGALEPGLSLGTPHPDAILKPEVDLEFAGEPGSFVQFAPAWGDMQASAHGTFGLFNEGAASPLHVHAEEYYGIVIRGELTNPFNLDRSPPTLTTGSYWRVPSGAVHVTACTDGMPCLFYFHARNAFDFTPVCE